MVEEDGNKSFSSTHFPPLPINLRCPHSLKRHPEMKMKPHTVLMSRGPWGMGSWPTHAAVKANDRWWKHCWQQHVIWVWNTSSSLRLNPSPRLQIFLGFVLFDFFFSFTAFCQNNINRAWSSLNRNNKKQVRVGGGSGGVDAEVDPDSYGGVVWNLILLWEDFLIVMQAAAAGMWPLALQTLFPFQGYYGTTCLQGTSVSGSLSGLARTRLCVHARVCECVCMCVCLCLRICLQLGLEEVRWPIVEFQLERKKALYERAPCRMWEWQSMGLRDLVGIISTNMRCRILYEGDKRLEEWEKRQKSNS